ncbi:MAG: DUF4386 domain-containing protein [Paracoccaceae bacterium]|nr:DUF4386 domain-containing protein [Paracoccaceae bacterium]
MPDLAPHALRRTGIIVGTLFIIATGFLFLGEAFYKQYLDAPDALTAIAGNRPLVVLGLWIELICILSMPLIGAFIFPVLRLYSTGMALTYFFFRALEGVILITVAQVNKWAMVSLSEASAASADPAGIEAAMALIRAQNAWGDTAGTLYNIIFVCGALCLYAVLFRARLVPRWISVWGLISATVLGVLALSAVFTRLPPMWEVALIAPLALQEIVMALWFIFRGFDVSALRDAPAK